MNFKDKMKQVAERVTTLKVKYYTLILFMVIILAFPTIKLSAQNECKITNNLFETLGGRVEGKLVKGSDSCRTMVMDDDFETITLKLGSIPAGAADFTIVNHDATPGANEIAVTYYYYSGNAVETLELEDLGKTAHVCVNNGKVTVTWNNVKFKGTVNGKISYQTMCEMTCTGF